MRQAWILLLFLLPDSVFGQIPPNLALADSNDFGNLNLGRATEWVFRQSLDGEAVPAKLRHLDSLRMRPDWAGYGWFDGVVIIDSSAAARPWVLSYYGPWAIRIWVNGQLTLRSGIPSDDPAGETLGRYLNFTQRPVRLSEGENRIRIEYSEHTVPWRFAFSMGNASPRVLSLFLVKPGEAPERRYRAFVFGGSMLVLISLFLLHAFLAAHFRTEYHVSVMLTIAAIGLHAFGSMSDSLIDWSFAYAPFNEIVYATVFIFVVYYFTLSMRLQLQLPLARRALTLLMLASVGVALWSAMNGRANLNILHAVIGFGMLGYAVHSMREAKRMNPQAETGILIGGFAFTIIGAMLYVIPYMAFRIMNPVLLSTAAMLAYSSIPIALTLHVAKSYAGLFRTMEQKVADRTAELRQANEYKSRFFANISHEFRTPLTIARGLLDRMAGRRLNDLDLQSELGPVQRNMSRLGDMVNQIVDLTKSDHDQMALNRRVYRIDSIVTLSVESFRSLAEHRRQTLVYTSDTPDAAVYADRLKLEIMINNLVSNAIKYTPEAGVIRITTEIREGHFILGVRDTGRGIPAEEREAIFERFHRIRQNDTDYVEGMGIGLELSRTLARLHGGDIRLVDSIPGEGSTFELSLPLSDGAEAEDILQDFDTYFHTLTRPSGRTATDRLLLVEDNDDMAAYITDVLQDVGEVRRATHGEEALAILDEVKPDLIITDLMMPNMGGSALITELRKLEMWHDVPVVVLTAKALEADKLDLLRIGVVDYITKPFSVDELVYKSRNLLNLGKKRKKAQIVLGNERTSLDRERLSDKAADWVKANIRDQSLSVDVLAEQLHLSRRTLYRLLEAETGMSSAEFIREIRLQTARSLLHNSRSATLDQVAEAVGYASGRNFRKLYHERFGVHPLDDLNKA